MSHTVALNFEDGFTRFVEGRPGETVADTSYRAGINVPLDCRDGACGTCKCRVQSGEYESGEYIGDALTEEEAADGLTLASAGSLRLCMMPAATALSWRKRHWVWLAIT